MKPIILTLQLDNAKSLIAHSIVGMPNKITIKPVDDNRSKLYHCQILVKSSKEAFEFGASWNNHINSKKETFGQFKDFMCQINIDAFIKDNKYPS